MKKKFNWQRKRQIRGLLDSWYDDESRGDREILKHLPSPIPLSKLLEKALKRAITDESLKFLELRESWSNVVGPDISKNCHPVLLQDGIIFIEVKDSIWLREMRQRQRELVFHIAKHCGNGFCREVRLIPAGRERRA